MNRHKAEEGLPAKDRILFNVCFNSSTVNTKQKAKEELSAVPGCLINFKPGFSSAMVTEQNKDKGSFFH